MEEKVLPFIMRIDAQDKNATEETIGNEARSTLQPFEESLAALQATIKQAEQRMEILGSTECIAVFRRVRILTNNTNHFLYFLSNSWRQILRAHDPWDVDAVHFFANASEKHQGRLRESITTLEDDIIELRQFMQKDLISD